MSEAENSSTGEGAAAGDTAPTVLYEKVGDRIARVTLNRPEVANAQSYEMLYALNDAFDRAVADDDVRVIVLAANGKQVGILPVEFFFGSSHHGLRDFGWLLLGSRG